MDGDPDRARDGDRDHERDRAARQRGRAQERAARERHGRAVHLGLRVHGRARRRASRPRTCTCRSNRAMELEITSKDVLHSFWVPAVRPEAGRRARAGSTRCKITPTKIGSYPVICTELCGLGHALMRRTAIVMSANDFAGKKWATGLPGGPVRGRRRLGRRLDGRDGLQVERLRELPYADRRARDGHRRPRPRQAARGGERRRPAATALHPPVDRGPERLHRAGLPGGCDAGKLRTGDLEA